MGQTSGLLKYPPNSLGTPSLAETRYDTLAAVSASYGPGPQPPQPQHSSHPQAQAFPQQTPQQPGQGFAYGPPGQPFPRQAYATAGEPGTRTSRASPSHFAFRFAAVTGIIGCALILLGTLASFEVIDEIYGDTLREEVPYSVPGAIILLVGAICALRSSPAAIRLSWLALSVHGVLAVVGYYVTGADGGDPGMGYYVSAGIGCLAGVIMFWVLAGSRRMAANRAHRAQYFAQPYYATPPQPFRYAAQAYPQQAAQAYPQQAAHAYPQQQAPRVQQPPHGYPPHGHP